MSLCMGHYFIGHLSIHTLVYSSYICEPKRHDTEIAEHNLETTISCGTQSCTYLQQSDAVGKAWALLVGIPEEMEKGEEEGPL